jgi:DNA-binding transcriptional MocR family regulator
MNEHIYQRLAGVIENQILREVLKIGDRLPSVRVLSQEQGVSMSTALQTYYHLEAKGLIEARPKSGYFVRFSPHRFPGLPEKSNPVLQPMEGETEDMIADVYTHLANDSLIKFSLSAPAPDLLPVAKLNKGMLEAVRRLPDGGTHYEDIQGNLNLRRQIARHARAWEGRIGEDEVVTTSGCMQAVSLALMAVCERGNTIAVESPTYFGILQLAHTLGLRVLELATDAQTGICLDALKQALEKHPIRACVLIGNFNNPLGSCMPDEKKRAAVRLLEKHGVPLIEDDLYGDVYFSKSRPRTCKTYDEADGVLWCGSVSKTVAPGYRVGWIAPGRYLEKIKRLKLFHSISSTTLTQEVIGRFLENGRYEHHLRQLRQVLHANSLHYMRAINDYFPAGTRVSRPQGGFVLWLELAPGIDTFDLYHRAMRHGISIAPGRMFTLQEQYRNCLRLSYGLVWEPRMEKALQKLGKLVHNF